MKIKDLAEPIKTWALDNQYRIGSFKNPNISVYALTLWLNTKEGCEFWSDVYSENFNFELLSKKYPKLDWGFQVEGDTFIKTDNSKVNENLLKENEELKIKLKTVEEWALERYDCSEDEDAFDNGISNSASTVLAILGINAHKAEAMDVLKDLSDEAKKELRKLLNED